MKQITITGKNNVKRITKDNVREKAKKFDIPEEMFFNHGKQVSNINSLYVTDECTYKDIIDSEINKKINGYIQQDKSNKIYDDSECMGKSDVIELLVSSKLQCNYCREKVYIIYKNVRQPDQWTLDRLDNDKGHNRNNCVVCCYKCNVQKKRMDDEKFRYSKQLRIIKTLEI